MIMKKGFYFLGHKTLMCEALDVFYPLMLMIGVPIIIITLLLCGCNKLYEYCRSLYFSYEHEKEEMIFLKQKEEHIKHLNEINYYNIFNDFNLEKYGIDYIENKTINNKDIYESTLKANNLKIETTNYKIIDENTYSVFPLYDTKRNKFNVYVLCDNNTNHIKHITYKSYIDFDFAEKMFNDILNMGYKEIYYEETNSDICKEIYKYKLQKDNIIITLIYKKLLLSFDLEVIIDKFNN